MLMKPEYTDVMLMFSYDAEWDAMYIAFRTIAPGEAHRTRVLHEPTKTMVDLNAEGEPIGVELLWVSEGVDLTGVPRANEIATAFGQLGMAAANIRLDSPDGTE